MLQDIIITIDGTLIISMKHQVLSGIHSIILKDPNTGIYKEYIEGNYDDGK